MLASLHAEGITTIVVPTKGDTRFDFTVTEASSGQQYRFVLPGPELSAVEIDEMVGCVAVHAMTCELVVVSGSLPPGTSPEVVRRLVAAAQRHHVDVIVDVPGDALHHAACAGVTMLKPSLHELAVHAGRQLDTMGDYECAARELLALGDNRAVLVSLAEAGALLVERGEPGRLIEAPPVQTVSVVGAGDSLVAGVALGLRRGLSLVEAVRWGVAAGTTAVQGTGTSLCRPDDVIAMVERVHISDLGSIPS